MSTVKAIGITAVKTAGMALLGGMVLIGGLVLAAYGLLLLFPYD
jgi:hypothetical protein